jgi:acyl-CoA carboxylase subunit beta
MDTKQETADQGTSVIYQLSLLEQAIGGAPLLVVGYGSPMKACVRACVKSEIAQIWVTGTKDKERGFACSGAAKVAMVGNKFDARLFTNVYAVMQAAKACNAGALLVVDPAFAADPLLRMVAYQSGMCVLTPMEKDRAHDLWRECKPDPEFGTYEPVWRRCPKCKLYHDEAPVLANAGECPTCHELYRLTSDERINLHFDEGSFQEWDAVMEESDPLSFPNFADLIEKQRDRSGLNEAVRTGKVKLAGHEVALCIMESTFMMGSMGSVVGEKITRAIERATDEGLPLFIFTASGGARMQEGLVSLMQMGKISAAIERHGRAGLLYVSIITDPTTGGVTASFAMQGDIIISEPHALIGFAGRRVIQDTIKQTLPEGFQTAEFALEHGLIDAIVERHDLTDVLTRILEIHTAPKAAEELAQAEGLPATAPVREVMRKAQGAVAARIEQAKAEGEDEERQTNFALSLVTSTFGKALGATSNFAMSRAMRKRGVADAPSVLPMKNGKKASSDSDNPAWDSVTMARNIHRPTSQYYIDHMVEGFIELHGDRSFADDGAIIGGIGWIDGMAVTVVAEEKGADLKQRIARNFGCPQPEGYRKSLRLMKQAEKFGRPIVCLVDTQGAFCGMEAEERGQGNAIADNLVAMAGLTVPVVSIVLGEGGSGGALALAMGNRVAMQDHAVYSVLSPEGFASILWKDRTRAAEAAAVMKMSAAEACEMGIIEEVVSEGEGPAHENPEQAAENVREYVVRNLQELYALSPEELRKQRYERFRSF